MHENEIKTQTTGFLFESRPGRNPPLLDSGFIALDGSRDRYLRRPLQALEQARDLALAVGDAQLFKENSDDPLTGPDLASETVGFGTVPEKVGDEPKFCVGDLGVRTGTCARAQRLGSAVCCLGKPFTHAPLGSIQSQGNGILLPA